MAFRDTVHVQFIEVGVYHLFEQAQGIYHCSLNDLEMIL